jgi:cyclophilin family peptidyl-prolyl cis-trans isomerase
LAAIDAIGEACRGDDDALLRMIAEARTPPNRGLWHRETHALVALARLSPSHAEIPLRSLTRHPVWQVRMYAARAAVVLNDAATLELLAADANDNVREATLAALKRIRGNGAASHFVAALGRSDYQLLLTAATESKGLSPTRELTAALARALKRVTGHRKDTSRDTRLALIQRLREIGTADVHGVLVELLCDFDLKVATAAADAMTVLTGGTYTAEPQPLPLPPLPNAAEIVTLKTHRAVLVMERGKNIELELDPDVAPMTAVRFLRLSNTNYFDGLTFHRVVPNFVVQGGSPGANEYAGDGPYLRDEISTRSHTSGTIGLSTRGRDTGDAQLFFNLVDNPRLDFEYTILGNVSGASLTRMYDILEGDVIRDVRWVSRRVN